DGSKRKWHDIVQRFAVLDGGLAVSKVDFIVGEADNERSPLEVRAKFGPLRGEGTRRNVVVLLKVDDGADERPVLDILYDDGEPGVGVRLLRTEESIGDLFDRLDDDP